MAALVLRDRAAFDGARLLRLGRGAPARPTRRRVFVRLRARARRHATFKLRKVDLQREGYDPARVADPLFVRDDAAQAYVPLDAEALARVGIAPFESSDSHA